MEESEKGLIVDRQGQGIARNPPNGATVTNAPDSYLLTHKSTGPRTAAGKTRSKRNSLKHGIFSNAVVLDGEPRKEFDSLLGEFRSSVRPEGSVEEFLVWKLASLAWRYRRMVIAERALFQTGTKSQAWDDFLRSDPSAEIFLKGEGRKNEKPGLIVGIDNPVILARCVERLQLLKNLIQRRGLEEETDWKILKTVYGDPLPLFSVNIVTRYASECEAIESTAALAKLSWQRRMQKEAEAERAQEASKIDAADLEGTLVDEGPSRRDPDEEEAEAQRAKKKQRETSAALLVGLLQEETDNLKAHAGAIEKQTAPEDEVEHLCRRVLDNPGLDRLLRYEASLERQFDRTLSQLERLQRMRLGQPVLPRIEVRHSLS